jgi:hypothetical protein
MGRVLKYIALCIQNTCIAQGKRYFLPLILKGINNLVVA